VVGVISALKSQGRLQANPIANDSLPKSLTDSKKKDMEQGMKRDLFVCLLAITSISTAALAEGVPTIQFDRALYDFGVTSLVEAVTGTFTFQNVGDGVLEVGKPKPSCGCTVAKISPETLKPGEKGELVFTVSLGTTGIRLAKEITVPSNDPQNPSVQLGITVESVSVFRAQPPSASFGELRLGTVTNATIMVKRVDGKKLTITRVEPSSNLISAKVEPVENSDGREALIRVEFKAEGRPRHFSELMRVYTDDSIGAALTVYVRAHVLGDIKLEPESLAWGMPDPEHWDDPHPDVILERTITITATDTNRELVLRNVTSDMKELNVKLVTLETNQQYQIIATLPKRLKESIHGTISFETNLPSMPKVDVPVEVNLWRQ
jgi:hypothetical protein